MSGPEYPEGLPPRPAPQPEPSSGPLPPLGVPAWAPLLAVLLVILGAVAIQVLVGSLIGITGGDTSNLEDNDTLTIVLTVMIDAVLVLAPIVVVTWLTHRRPLPAAFGLRVPEWRSALKTTLAIYGAFWVAVIVIGVIAGQARDQEIVTELKAEDSVPVLIGFVVMTCVAAPLAEEFFFRGFVFGVLREKIGKLWGVLATGLVFGLVHVAGSPIETVGVLIILGSLLCVLYLKTGSLLPCIALHAINNSISFAATKELHWAEGVAIVILSTGAAVAVASAVTQRPALFSRS
jgi:CAAX protease family protein